MQRSASTLTVALPCALVAILVAGCAGRETTMLTGPVEWTGLGATFIVPPGDWRVLGPAGDENYASFSQADGDGVLVLMRMDTLAGESPWVSLQKLFVDFRRKDPLGHWEGTTHAGEPLYCIGFLLRAGARRTPVAACAVPGGETTWHVVAWGFERGFGPVRTVAEEVAGTLKMASEHRP
jgi:hypothetical protein